MDIMGEIALAVFGLSADGIFIESVNGDILMCNQAGAEMFGYTVEEITKLNIRDLIPRLENSRSDNQYINDGIFPQGYARLAMKKDGTLIRTQVNAKAVASNGGEYRIALVRETAASGFADPAVSAAETLAYKRRREGRVRLPLLDSVGREKFSVPLEMVEYMESNLKKLFLHLTNGAVLKGYGTLNRLEQELILGGSFLRCHQSYIVNMQYADLDEHLRVFAMRSGARVLIRKRQYARMKKAYDNYKIAQRAGQ